MKSREILQEFACSMDWRASQLNGETDVAISVDDKFLIRILCSSTHLLVSATIAYLGKDDSLSFENLRKLMNHSLARMAWRPEILSMGMGETHDLTLHLTVETTDLPSNQLSSILEDFINQVEWWTVLVSDILKNRENDWRMVLV